jgi:hypothetical protein
MFSRTYSPVPQIPTAPNYGPIPLNSQIPNKPLLPFQFPTPTTVAQTVLNPALSTVGGPYPLLITVPSRSFVQGVPFKVIISGLSNTPTASIATIALTLGSGLTGNQTLSTFTSAAAIAGLWPFWLEASLIADGISGRLNGVANAMLQGVYFPAVQIAGQSGLNFNTDPVMSFGAIVQSSVANANAYFQFNEVAIY